MIGFEPGCIGLEPGCCACLLFQDDFNRLTNSYVGAAWTEDDGYELEGDWWVVGSPIAGNLQLNVYSEINPTDWPLIRCRAPMVNNRGTVYVETVEEHADEGELAGDKYRIFVNLRENPAGVYSYYFAEFDVEASSVSLWKVVDSGAPELLISPTNPVFYAVTGTHRTFWVGINEDIFCAGVSEATAPLCEFAHYLTPTLFSGPTYSGLGGTTGQTYLIFDNYKLYRDQEDFPQGDCPGCGCKCEGRSVPHILHVVLTATGGMSAADGLEFDMEYGGPGSVLGPCDASIVGQYHGEISFCGVPWLFSMSCPQDNPADTTMKFLAPDGSAHTCDNVLTWPFPHALVAVADTALCTPAFLFEFHWDWWYGPISNPCDACNDPPWDYLSGGTLTATVTE